MFGQNIRENWCTSLKPKQKYEEVLREETKSTPTTFSRNNPPHFQRYLQHHMKEVVEGMHNKHSSLDQCHKHKDNIVRVIKSPFLSIPELLDVGSTFFGEKAFPCQSKTSSPGRNNKILFQNFEKIN